MPRRRCPMARSVTDSSTSSSVQPSPILAAGTIGIQQCLSINTNAPSSLRGGIQRGSHRMIWILADLVSPERRRRARGMQRGMARALHLLLLFCFSSHVLLASPASPEDQSWKRGTLSPEAAATSSNMHATKSTPVNEIRLKSASEQQSPVSSGDRQILHSQESGSRRHSTAKPRSTNHGNDRLRSHGPDTGRPSGGISGLDNLRPGAMNDVEAASDRIGTPSSRKSMGEGRRRYDSQARDCWMGLPGWNEDGEPPRPAQHRMSSSDMKRSFNRDEELHQAGKVRGECGEMRETSEESGIMERRIRGVIETSTRRRKLQQASTEGDTALRAEIGKETSEDMERRAAGKRHRRMKWLDFLTNAYISSGRNQGDLLEELRTAGSISTTKLDRPLNKSLLHWIPLDPYFDQNFAPQVDSWPVRCPQAPECPQFASCGRQSVRVPPNLLPPDQLRVLGPWGTNDSIRETLDFSPLSACSISSISSAETSTPQAPLNCPRIPCTEQGCEHPVFDPSCSHVTDDIPGKRWQSWVYHVHDVYLNSHGELFNNTRFFDRSGCASYDDFAYPVGFPVINFDTVISLAHWSTSSFYHGIIELVPMFFVFSHLPRVFKSHPIAVELFTMDFLHAIGSFLLGPDVTLLNVRILSSEYIFHANTVVQPLYQACGVPCPTLWREMRRLHLVPSDGLPMFNPDWTPRRAASPAPTSGFARRDWVVILIERHGSRALVQHTQALRMLQGMFPPDRVVVFSGNLDISDAKELFNRAVLVVGVHGAAMTNIIFMPFHATLVELRPRNYDNACYHHLSEVCDLNYFLHLCDGAFETPTSCDMGQVRSVLDLAMSHVKSMIHDL